MKYVVFALLPAPSAEACSCRSSGQISDATIAIESLNRAFAQAVR